MTSSVWSHSQTTPQKHSLSITPGTRYHLRVSVQGREAGLERSQYDTGEPPVESHLIQMWSER